MSANFTQDLAKLQCSIAIYIYIRFDPLAYVNQLVIHNITDEIWSQFNNASLKFNINRAKLNFSCNGAINYTIQANKTVVPPTEILGCDVILESFPPQCARCNAYSKVSLDRHTCDCKFAYNITFDI